MKTEDRDDYTITYDDSRETKDKLFDKLLAFFHEHETYTGESIQQSDGPQIEAPNLLADLADDIFQFERKWKGEA